MLLISRLYAGGKSYLLYTNSHYSEAALLLVFENGRLVHRERYHIENYSDTRREYILYQGERLFIDSFTPQKGTQNESTQYHYTPQPAA